MKTLRAPAVPIVTVDPYFSIWSRNATLNAEPLVHWTGTVNDLVAYAKVDGVRGTFLGFDRTMKNLKQTSLEIDALSTRATFEGFGIRVKVRAMTPRFPDDYELFSRPVSYVEASWESVDGRAHEVTFGMYATDSLCLDRAGEAPVVTEEFSVGGVNGLKMGAAVQKPLNRKGDDLRIDWGYLYLGVRGEGNRTARDRRIEVEQTASAEESPLFLVAYDDVESIRYFGKNLVSPWRDGGKCIRCAITAAAKDYEALRARADVFAAKLTKDATDAGGKQYAELLSLAYRQVVAGHKLVRGGEGELLFISKECFSNGCAATVDVSYPSVPMFLYYNPELVRAMMRPIYRYATSDAWNYDFAPHDVGTYPIVEGQVYALNDGKFDDRYQMPVEECGNMIIMEAAATLADGKTDAAAKYFDTLEKWVKYLIRFGDDPENQLCTDDFAGHLAHNCNLSLKAIMGIVGMSILCDKLGKARDAETYAKIAKEKADGWISRAANGDGSYRLAFDRPDTFSMKYNMVWDKIFGTNLFPAEVVDSEVESYFGKMNEYGLPLDCRAAYTKSDWLVWVATMAKTKADFEKFIAPLYRAYDETLFRVPLTDWYDTRNANQITWIDSVGAEKAGFQHRTVQGGLFIKLLDESKKLVYKK